MEIALTVIIPSWQTRAYLVDCLSSIGRPDGVRVIVVDGASSDGSADAAAARLPPGDVIRLTENRGFAYAVNTGIRLALDDPDDAGPVVLLNTDTLVTPAALATLADHLQRYPQTAAAAPQLVLRDGSPQPYGFGSDPTPGYLLRRGWNRLVHKRALHAWGAPSLASVDWVSFACVAIQRKALHEVGVLDEAYYMYFEDNDWCLRARRQGWRIDRVPASRIVHFGGGGLQQNPRAARAYRQSLQLLYRKHYGWCSRALLTVMLPVYVRWAQRGTDRSTEKAK